jgi:2-C-methyl-D-erythritol 2,4-cyclodiphosphate synthase
VLLHAITDALLGAVSAGDIGTFFPPSDPRWKGAASSVFLQTALEEIATAGYKIVNIDTVLVMAQPKIVPSPASCARASPGCWASSPAK